MTDATELPINQKEYLKKYLAIGKAPGEKKKKKKKAAKVTRVQIIDDDEMPAPASTATIQTDPILIDEDEDAPQIVAIIDERPHFMRTDDKTKNPLWQPVGTVHENTQIEQKPQMISFKIQSKGSEKLPDRSPPRRKKKLESSTSKNKDDAVDIVIKEERLTPPRSDDVSPPRRENEEDISPPQKEKSQSQDDMSPPRRSRNVDLSPPRKRPTKSDDISPPRRSRNVERDSSPPRRSRNVEKDSSPPRKSRNVEKNSSPKRSTNYEKDHSPPRRRKDPKQRERKSRFDQDYGESHSSKSEEKSQKKMEKTLDGKKAGLQNASDLVEETRNFKNREDKMFKSLSRDMSGQNAETVHRNRQTGRIRNLEEEEERERKKKEEEEKQKEKYERWGRGLAQIESRDRQVQEQLHEMSKPLARYADDEDLERFLKEQEREGDPMLAYLRKKKRKKAADAGEVAKPQFQGDFLPNRYGIRPGHRWDGVDRSSGYEKKWFDVQNQKRAILEDSYKWSTEDM